eukprot:CAMPEP_0198285218 /NCGR_PEP_ID=MMETSP1449-20131203/4535_1 /TAXON_ID=420275 /ORGANISM="Attheya septentrionalis, Strain CCMP2084" /LENGTH=825 /DNA_ID=CAMNT_0043982549 /DNA_START=132 /DNA_END=2609 /DNA_ORIENTATION=+
MTLLRTYSRTILRGRQRLTHHTNCRRSTLAEFSTAVKEESNEGNANSAACLYPTLFSPLKLKGDVGTLPNRVIMGSMHTGLEGHSIPSWVLPLLGKTDDDHKDLSSMAAYFVERAKGGVGLIVTGGISPNREGWVGPFAAKLSTEAEMERHRIVTDSVHSVQIPMGDGTSFGGDTVPARICMQILHAGRYAMHPLAVSASNTKAPISPFRARQLSLSGVQSTVSDFIHCAVLAKKAGYDGVEIMGSEGYLINQFLVNRTNKRTDAYGGSDFLNRIKFAVEIVKGTRDAVGNDFIIIFRLSMMDLIKDGSSWDEVKILAQAMEDAGATILNTGIGWHEARIPTIATSVPRGMFAYVTQKLREEGVVDIPLCATNRINAPHVAESILSGNSADLVSMARPLLADPDIVLKSREGRADEINTCIACNQACLDHAFVGKTASCLVNPRACHELELQITPNAHASDKDRRKIAVVGTGPAGLAFATTAATLGHDVTVFDKATEIGGQFNMAKRIPGKEEFHETIRYFDTLLKKLQAQGKVTMQLGTCVTHDFMKSHQTFDKWIVATGVNPRMPPIPGVNHPNVLSYIDVLRHNAPVGKRVAIIGAGGIGFDVAEFLIHHGERDLTPDELNKDDWMKEWGVDKTNAVRGGVLPSPDDDTHNDEAKPKRKIVMMQRKPGKLGAGLGRTTGWIHRATLAKSHAVQMVGGVTYNKVDENGYLHITVTDPKSEEKVDQILEVDNIILCAGQTPHNELETSASTSSSAEKDDYLASRVYTIGGAYEALELDAKRAIDMGTRLALEIHDESVVPGKHKFESDVGPEEKLFSVLKRFM